MTRTGTAEPVKSGSGAVVVLGAMGIALALSTPPVSAEPVPVDPYQDCPTLIYYTVPENPPGLFEIADTTLGDPVRASEIYEYTSGRTQPDGGRLGPDQELLPGWYLIMPYDAAGDGVLQGQDPLCVSAVDQALAQGVDPPEPPAPPSSPEPSPSPSASPTDEAKGPGGIGRPNIDPKILIAGMVALALLTILALFWQPIFRGVSWPFRRIAALPWRMPKPPRFVRTMRRDKRRRMASDIIAADRGAAKRANIGFLELMNAPAEVPARPIAVFTAPKLLTMLVPANSTPPAASWRVLKPTIWRHSRSRSATSAVRFNTTTHTNLGMTTDSTLVSVGVIERARGGEQVFVDFGRLDGLITIGGHGPTAREAVRVIGDGLRECGLTLRALKGQDTLGGMLPPSREVAPRLDAAPLSGPVPRQRLRRALMVSRPLSQSENDDLPLVPNDTLVIAQGESEHARWHWIAAEDGTVDTGPIGITLTLRDSREREHKRAQRIKRRRQRRNRRKGG